MVYYPHDARLAEQQSAAAAQSSTPQQFASEQRRRLVAANQTQIVTIENPETNERIAVMPADWPEWQAKGWRRIVDPLPNS
jgi:hypothetical protein